MIFRQPLAAIRLLCTLVLLALCGCIPAQVPDNLDDTPGPPVVVDNNIYQGAVFSAEIPAGWRIITGEAQAPQSVIFVAPDEKTVIWLIAGQVKGGDLVATNQRNEMYPVTLADGSSVTTVFRSPYSTWAHYYPEFEKVRDSLSSH